jgi:hypothetical protein
MMDSKATIRIEMDGLQELADEWATQPGVKVETSSGFDAVTLVAVTASIAQIVQLCLELRRACKDGRRGAYQFGDKEMAELTPAQMAEEAMKDARESGVDFPEE